MKSKSALVIGAGVIGATTAYELLEKGYDVTLLAKQFAQGDYSVTSEVASAQWEFPPGICGRHRLVDFNLENPKKWTMVSYKKFLALSKNSSQTGVVWRPLYVFLPEKMEETPEQIQRIKDMSIIPTFKHSTNFIKQIGISPTAIVPVVDCYTVDAPTIDTVKFIEWLYKQCRAKGAKFANGEIKGKLIGQIEDLKAKYNVNVVVNCTGLAARELADDKKVSPLRGYVLKIRNDGVLMPKLDFSIIFHHAIFLNPGKDNSNVHIYIIPRGDHSIWIGGSVEEHETDLTGVDMSHAIPRRLLDNAKAFFPPLRAFDYKDVDQVIAGLRPAREDEIRNEIDPECASLIHNYGHAGNGIYLSWGSAVDVVKLADKAVGIFSKL
ncbi:D-amino-acid oxidase-like [Actinia tenebrosa]|uniref:D-amino-acid oxidase-like n=1 Tax=Actinia tenebrosa TaxID=6105 RepID=A0A6P8JBA3_ACTTE|nr:D-amino-acid oxidase-like [Actinia tenebrosa]